ncbi:MAG: GHKL domain-containing protein [Peptococcaceae bacterium]|nr:GHKL domain-containing protein [Peptococcaceae bacterium]
MNPTMIFRIAEGVEWLLLPVILYFALRVLAAPRFSRWLTASGYAVLAGWLLLLALMPVADGWRICGIAAGVLVLLGLYRMPGRLRLIGVALVMAVLALSFALAALVLGLLLKDGFDDVHAPGLGRLLVVLCGLLIFILPVRLGTAYYRRREDPIAADECRMFAPLFACQLLSIIIAAYIYRLSSGMLGIFTYLGLIALLCIVYLNVVFYWYFDRIRYTVEYKSRCEAAEYKLSLERKYHALLAQHQADTDALWHDMKKHLRLMKALIAEGESDRSAAYAHDLEARMDGVVKIIRTGEPVLDALLTEEMRRARAANVPFEINARLEGPLAIAAIDLCTILDNLFDNALAASENLADGTAPEIRLSIGQQGGALYIEMTNPYTPKAPLQAPAPRHGLGLKNIRDTVRANGGTFTITDDGQTYHASVILP